MATDEDWRTTEEGERADLCWDDVYSCTLVTDITAEAGLPDSGGVRIAVTEEGSQLQMELAPEPQAGDDVIDTEGAIVSPPPPV